MPKCRHLQWILLSAGLRDTPRNLQRVHTHLLRRNQEAIQAAAQTAENDAHDRKNVQLALQRGADCPPFTQAKQ